MKHYTTPRLVARGDVVEQTKGPFMGDTDPNGTTIHSPCGSVGFAL